MGFSGSSISFISLLSCVLKSPFLNLVRAAKSSTGVGFKGIFKLIEQVFPSEQGSKLKGPANKKADFSIAPFKNFVFAKKVTQTNFFKSHCFHKTYCQCFTTKKS